MEQCVQFTNKNQGFKQSAKYSKNNHLSKKNPYFIYYRDYGWHLANTSGTKIESQKCYEWSHHDHYHHRSVYVCVAEELTFQDKFLKNYNILYSGIPVHLSHL